MKFITHKMCPFAQKAWIGLELCNVPYEMQEIPLYGANGKPAWFRSLNPKGTVPTLVNNDDDDDNTTVWTDSDDILDYLEEKTNGSFREWRYDLINRRLLPVAKKVVLGGNQNSHKKELHSILQEINDHELICNSNDLNIAQCHAFPFLWRLDQDHFIDAENFSNIETWLRNCERHPAVAKTIQPNWWWWW